MTSVNSRRSTLTLKIKAGAHLEDALSGLEGVLDSSPAFPGDTDPDLASVYRLDVEASTVQEIKAQLESSPLVDYVEEPRTRRLIRPGNAGK